MHIKEKPMLPPKWILKDNQIIMHSFSNHAEFTHLYSSVFLDEKKT
ncbi:16848_t:CDS:2 [Funneliformis geosporum]|nr:16848_t:CDS:2 [Funneliformis geosporum]